MNIEFDKIIELAKTRKDKLNEIVALLDQADDMFSKWEALMNWTYQLKATFALLDEEGRSLLPPSVTNTLRAINVTEEGLRKAYRYPFNCYEVGLHFLRGHK